MAIKKDGNKVILSADPTKVILAELKNKGACKNYRNCLSGTFQYNNAANAILIYGNNVISNLSAHGWLGFPDTCLIYYKDGGFAVKRIMSIPTDELKKVQWAISGVGLLSMWAPEKEGYAKFTQGGERYDYSDVLRRTHHTAIGVKDGIVYGFYLPNMTGAEVNAYMKERDMDFAVMMDGGHVAAVNSDITNHNASQKQHNIIQFVQSAEQEVDEVERVMVYSLAREGNKNVSANFKAREYRCRDGSDAVYIHEELAKVLQEIRTHFARPVNITSAFRSHAHNLKEGGEADSQHLYGMAADIALPGVSPSKVAAYAETLMPDHGGIGVYEKKGFCHVDVRSKKARWNG